MVCNILLIYVLEIILCVCEILLMVCNNLFIVYGFFYTHHLILKLSQEVNIKNYLDIITFLQKNKYDINNKLIDQINRTDE